MKDPKSSYLSTMKFDPKLLKSWHAKYLRNIRLPILLTISIIMVGIYALITIPRRLNPEIKIPIVVVNTSLPGANPEDVESLLTDPLERAVSSVDGIDTLASTSQNGNSSLSLQFLSTVNTDKARSDVQAAVDTVSDLPEDATTPRVRSVDFEDQPVWTFAVTTRRDIASLMRFSDILKDALEDTSKVDRVVTSGLDAQDIEVIIDTEKIHELNINPTTVAQLVQGAVNSYPAGNISSSDSSFALTINRDINSVEDIRNLNIQVKNTTVRLGEIAQIVERNKSGQQDTYIARSGHNPARTVQFFVYKKKGSNIDASYKDARSTVDKILNQYHGQFEVTTVLNTADEITTQFAELFGDFQTTVILVFILLFVFLGLRQAIIASITVPLTFLASFAIINALGLTLNFLTTFSFLLSLGLLIDDTIVTVAAMTRYHRTGNFTPYETGVVVWRDFIVPLWSTTITTIWAFVPLLLSTGIIGEFIKSIPIVVTTTMLSSTTIAVFITMPLMIIFLKPQFPRRVKILLGVLAILAYISCLVLFLPKNIVLPFAVIASCLLLFVTYYIRREIVQKYKQTIDTNKKFNKFMGRARSYVDYGVINIEVVSRRYRLVIDRILRSSKARTRVIVAIAIFTVVAYLLVPLGLVKNEFFPKQEADLMYVGIDMPAGTRAQVVEDEMLRFLSELRRDKKIEYIVGEIGQSIGGDGDRAPDPDAILYTVHLPKEGVRKFSSLDFAEELRTKYKNYSQGVFSVVELSGGPPAGSDVQIKLIGRDLGVLDSYASQVVSYLKKQKGLTNVDKSLKQGTSKVVFEPDKTKLASEGITINQIGLWLRTYASGFILDTVQFGDVERDIVLRTNAYDDQSLEALSNIQIPTQSGAVPLLSLGKLRVEANPTAITREDQKRTISVSATAAKGTSAADANANLIKYVKSLNLQSGYSYATGGANEENQKSVQSILMAMVLSFLLIMITMVLEFGSFRQALISMMLIPISTASVFYIFALTHTPLSFAALIGILALFGIVVTHAIVVIEKINENRAHGLSLRDAITDAAANRLEPVLLTSFATIVGLLPITIADPFWRGLGGAIIAGLLFSGLIKLFFVPVLYYNFFVEQDKKKARRTL